MSVVWTPDEPQRRPRLATLEDRARAFHAANPQVFTKLLEIARDLRARGVRKAGMKLLFERLRWISQVETQGDAYRLNNSFTSWYARQLMATDPSLSGLFETRESAHDPNYRQRVISKAARLLRAQARPVPPSSTPEPRSGSLF